MYGRRWILYLSNPKTSFKARVSPGKSLQFNSSKPIIVPLVICPLIASRHFFVGSYKSKSKKFTTPAFNFDEVVKPPNNSIHLAFNKTNKIQGLAFKSGNCNIWGLQYHPEIHYDYMVRLINDRREKLIRKKCFKNNEEINNHIQFIGKERDLLDDDFRLLEIKNWLNFISKN